MADPPPKLPEGIEPMLARPSQPFDSADHLFEPKWDGIRAIVYIDGGGKCRMLNRRRREIGWRYPELSFLADLPAGTVRRGEGVWLGPDGPPPLQALPPRDEGDTASR